MTIRLPRKMIPEVCEAIKTLYLDEKLTQKEIGELFHIAEPTITIFLKSQGLSRSTSAANLLAIKRGRRNAPNKKDFLQEEMVELYVQHKLSCKEIGLKMNTHPETVRKYIKLRGILRSRSEEIKLCHTKYPQMHKSRVGKDAPMWKGGRHTNFHGYVEILDRAHSNRKSGYILEHILVWEQLNNRKLPDGWEVHHRNGIKDDNKPKNLFGCPGKKHKLIIPDLQKRIRELEAEVKLLEKTLDDNQLIFHIEEN